MVGNRVRRIHRAFRALDTGFREILHEREGKSLICDSEASRARINGGKRRYSAKYSVTVKPMKGAG